MDVNKAIIHAIDSDLKSVILSEFPMNLNNAKAIETYILKLVKGLVGSTSSSKAKLGENSSLNNLLNTQLNFVESTQKIAREWFEHNVQSMDYVGTNLIFALIDLDESVALVMFELLNKDGFIKITQNQHGVENSLVHNHAILPSTFSSIPAAFMLNLGSAELTLKYNAENKDRIESLLDCTIIANSKDSFRVVGTLVDYISEQRDEDGFKNIVKAKQVITDNIEFFDEIEPKQILKEVFEDLSDDEESIVSATFEDHNVVDMIDLKTMKRTSVAKRHRIKTESGIEIILPLDILDVSDIVDIKTDINGRVTIELKDIGKIVE
ncbi:nucleoid-associated protein [Erysipelothrix sp. HDW6C]|uniref:nucleoid-associated protein n=1 Tax=Erysipelothrix sp. HDW6C TaxID=2714930 RepID=UPI00140B517F|nr:nucleoid-associated protein [Erysipelothrix sp. HDW6C]QIK70011.1 nucleoid-associated protein [Erysipelothrix sp. HDW6C]